MPPRPIHLKDAFALLEDGKHHDLRLWKLSTGDILSYRQCICTSGWHRGGTHRVRLAESGQVRELRDVTLFEIDGHTIYW